MYRTIDVWYDWDWVTATIFVEDMSNSTPIIISTDADGRRPEYGQPEPEIVVDSVVNADGEEMPLTPDLIDAVMESAI